MKFIAVAVMSLTALAQGVALNPSQQPTQPPAGPVMSTGAISGVVVDGVGKEPIEDVTVVLTFVNGSTTIRRQDFTDAKGRFVFPNLPPGEKYTLTTSAPGYIDGGYSRDPARAFSTLTNVALNADQWVSDLVIQMSRPSSIAGRVLDDAGEPMVAVFVRALKRERAGGRDIYTVGPITSTDDTGAYRISNLDPGHYVINVPSVQGQAPTPNTTGGSTVAGRYPWRAASAADRRPLGYAPTFYPTARTPSEAQPIDLAVAQARTGVDVTLRAVPLYRVSGIVPGTPYPLALRLVPEGSETLGLGGDVANTFTQADGSFVFESVPAGTYSFETGRHVVQISGRRSAGALFGELRLPDPPRPGGPGGSGGFGLPFSAAPPDVSLMVTKFSSQGDTAPSFLARTTISVGGTDTTGVIVPLEAGASFSGRVIWDTNPDKPELKPTNFDQSLTLEPAGRNPNQLRMIDTTAGVFKEPSVNPGEYWIRKRGAVSTWVVKSITVAGSDRTTRPADVSGAVDDVVVTLTSRGAAITGSVKEPAAVIAFPQDQSQWSGYGFNPPNMRVVDTGTNGLFTIDRLPAGDYFVIAVDPARRLDWLEQGFFAAAAPLATRVSVTWGESKSAALAIAAVRR